MSKYLFCASTVSHIRNFHLPYMRQLQEYGHEVWCAVDHAEAIPYTNQVVIFPFTKSLLSMRNFISVFRIRKLLMAERFEKISTNTALSSAILRLAVLTMPKKSRPTVFYIVHGFLFHKSDGPKKWVYLLPEIMLAPVTDTLMVMNQEDLEIAEKYRLYKEKLVFIDGIGIELSKFHPMSQQDREAGRCSLGFSEKDYLFIYAAEFSKRKNQQQLIRAFAKAADHIPNAHLLLAGVGARYQSCNALIVALNMEQKIHCLGHVKEMDQLYPLCDAAVSSSRIEGLPFNIMEAMSCGLPVLVSNIKGHRDLVGNRMEALFQTEQELCEKLIQHTQNRQKHVDWSGMLDRCTLNRVLPVVLQQYTQTTEPQTQVYTL